MTTKICLTCKKEFHCKPSQATKKKYCSRACLAEGYSTKMSGKNNPNYRGVGDKVCARCGKAFYSRDKDRKYCSRDCYNTSPQKRLDAKKANDSIRLPPKFCKKCGVQVGPQRKLCDNCKPKKRVHKCLNCNRPVSSDYDVDFCKDCRVEGLSRKQYFSTCMICMTEFPGYNRKYCDNCWSFVQRSKRGTARKVDANQAEIVEALRAIGCSVVDCSAIGGGFPDLAVGRRGETYLIEVKNPDARGKLNKLQEEWHARWNGQVAIARTIEEALAIVGAI